MLPPPWWLMLTLAYLIPVVHVICPPSVPDREGLKNLDQKTRWSVLPLVREIVWGLTIVYCVVLFVVTFIY